MANTPTQNLLEEEGRIDAEKAFTKKGKDNLKFERTLKVTAVAIIPNTPVEMIIFLNFLFLNSLK